jgi:hypothetical protein
VNNGYYQFQLRGRFLCPKAFCLVLNISTYKLRRATQILKGEAIAPLLESKPTHQAAPKSALITTVLQCLKDTWSIEKELKQGEHVLKCNIIQGFYDEKAVFEWFILVTSRTDITFDWFKKVWKRTFPALVTAKDRPCMICNSLFKVMLQSQFRDPKKYAEAKAKHDEHMANAQDIRNYIENEINCAKLRLSTTSSLVIVMDHFGVHYIPCFKQSLDEFRSLEGHGVLGVYFSGVHNAVQSTNDYLIYNEPLTENSNVNCYHFDRYLAAYLENRELTKIVIVSDTCAKIRFVYLSYLTCCCLSLGQTCFWR